MKSKLALFAVSSFAFSTLHAATRYWDSSNASGLGGSATWGTTFSSSINGNTTLVTAASGDDLIFQGTAGTITLAANQTANSLTFNTTGYKITGSSTTTRTITGAITLANNVALTIGNAETADRIVGVGSVSGGSGSGLNINGSATGTNHIRLNLSSSSANISVPVTVSGSGFAAIVSTAASTQITNTVTGSGNRLNLGATSGNALTITQTIDNGSGVIRIAAGSSGGAGVLTLSGSNNTWGNTELNNATSGILRMGTSNALPTSTTLTYGQSTGNGDSIVELNGNDTTIGQLTNGAQSGGVLRNTNAASATLTISGSDTSASAFSGALQDGTGGGKLNLIRSGTGSTTLSNTSSYTGTTQVTGGKLVVNGNISTSSLTTVSGTGTLGGSGTVGALTAASGGTIAPGNSPGILNAGNTELQAGSTLSMEINGVTAGTNYDQLNVTGTVSLAGALNLTISGFTPTLNSLFFIINNDGTDAVTGTFSNTLTNGVLKMAGQDWLISYTGDSTSNSFTGGNDVVLQTIPETSSALLSVIGSLALLRRRRNA